VTRLAFDQRRECLWPVGSCLASWLASRAQVTCRWGLHLDALWQMGIARELEAGAGELAAGGVGRESQRGKAMRFSKRTGLVLRPFLGTWGGSCCSDVQQPPGTHAGPSSSPPIPPIPPSPPPPWTRPSLVSRSAANNNSSQRVWEHSNLHWYARVLHCKSLYNGRILPIVPLAHAWTGILPECPQEASVPIPDDVLALPPLCV
jgi:hypothetical protein